MRLELDQVEVEPILEMGDDIIQTLKDKAWPVESNIKTALFGGVSPLETITSEANGRILDGFGRGDGLGTKKRRSVRWNCPVVRWTGPCRRGSGKPRRRASRHEVAVALEIA